jgi:hypothetical protein
VKPALRLPALALLLLGAAAGACAQDLPKELNGRWTWGNRATQTFALENIVAGEGGTFAAQLTWWTMESRCAIRGEPVTGKVTPGGLSFASTTKCNNSFRVTLDRAADGWKGNVVTDGPNSITADVTAR